MGQPSLYVLGADAIQRLDLENTPPPPQSGPGVDLMSVFVIVLMVALVAFAVLSRRQRRLFSAALDRPVGLHTKDGAQREQQKPDADKDLLVAHQAKGEQ
jgi:hypothetical protein